MYPSRVRSGWGSAWGLASVLAFAACGDDDVDPAAFSCVEYVSGDSVDPKIGGSAASYVTVQAALDYFLIARTSSFELTAMCEQIAADVGVAPRDVDAALATVDQIERMKAVCRLAADAIVRERGSGGGVTLPDVTCTTPAAFESACRKRCVPASADCATACTASAHARAVCPEPAVARVHLRAVLALRAHLKLMVADGPELAAAVNKVSDIRAVCVPQTIVTTSEAVSNVKATFAAAEALVDAVEGK